MSPINTDTGVQEKDYFGRPKWPYLTGNPELDASREQVEKALWERRALHLRLETILNRLAEFSRQDRLYVMHSSLRKCLARRGPVPNEEQNARIQACTDVEILAVWVERSIFAATSVAEALA